MNRYCIICNEEYEQGLHNIDVIHKEKVDALRAMLDVIDEITIKMVYWPTKRLVDFRMALDLFVSPTNSYFSKVYSFIMIGNLDRVLQDRIESKRWIRENILYPDVSELIISYMD